MAVKIYSEQKDFFVDDIKTFAKDYQLIVAAGGLVYNEAEQLLFIFRRGKWDLPKGKLDEGESPEQCADREIKEETGIKELLLQEFIITTYHTYTEKGKDILKETHWYEFNSPGQQKLDPQTKEDIAKAGWVRLPELFNYMNNTYPLIADVLSAAGVQF